MKKIMVFAPHPDDDIIGCGGSIAHHVAQGNLVSIVYMTSGEAGSLQYPKEDLARIREAEARKAASLLGVSDLIFLKNPDGYIENNQDNLIKIVNLIRDKKPSSIYVPHHNDFSRDHHTTHQLVLEACNRAKGPWFQECAGQPWSVDNILGYEVWTPLQETAYSQDITPFMDIKLTALQQHQSQLESIQYDEAIKGLNRYRGIMTGQAAYCECFQVIKAKFPA